MGGQDAEGRPRPVTVVDAGSAKELDLEVIVPVEDMRELGGERSTPDNLTDVAGIGEPAATRSGRRCTPSCWS